MERIKKIKNTFRLPKILDDYLTKYTINGNKSEALRQCVIFAMKHKVLEFINENLKKEREKNETQSIGKDGGVEEDAS